MGGCIVVLGNGFDLNCGLDSKFSDFFRKKIENKIFDYYSWNCSNFWYLLLYLKFYNNDFNDETVIQKVEEKDPLWMDVEGFIKEIATDQCISDVYINKSYLDVFNEIFEKRNNQNYMYTREQVKLIKHFFRTKFNYMDNDFDAAEFLYNELKDFEKDFAVYLNNELFTKIQFQNAYDSLFEKIIDGNEIVHLISFNYTRIEKHAFQHHVFLNANYIHGAISLDEIIIGFDSSDIINNHVAIRMSKSWQKNASRIPGCDLPKKEDINEIIFYGHSLGSQDYSYFHALFDFYDIYNSSVKLIFCYSKYGKTDKENNLILTNYNNKIYKLLNDYALNSGKETKYKTIIARLQLENRLKIKVI